MNHYVHLVQTLRASGADVEIASSATVPTRIGTSDDGAVALFLEPEYSLPYLAMTEGGYEAAWAAAMGNYWEAIETYLMTAPATLQKAPWRHSVLTLEGVKVSTRETCSFEVLMPRGRAKVFQQRIARWLPLSSDMAADLLSEEAQA